MRPKGARYLVQYTHPEQGFLNEVSASSLNEANRIAEDLVNDSKASSVRIIKSDDIRMPKRTRKERS